jgi:hypothetical protein
MVGETAEAMNHSASAVEDLANMARELNQVMGKLPSGQRFVQPGQGKGTRHD